MKPVFLHGLGQVSAVGAGLERYKEGFKAQPSFPRRVVAGTEIPVAALPKHAEEMVVKVAQKRPFRHLDRTVHMAVLAAEEAILHTHHTLTSERTGVIVASSRGPTQSLEKHFNDHSSNVNSRLSPYASPSTTAGNLASTLAQVFSFSGPVFSLSMTCSSGLQAIITATAYLKAGLADNMLVVAAEAPLTDFTLASLKSLGVLSTHICSPYPAQPLAINPPEGAGMLLGEGAVAVLMSTKPESIQLTDSIQASEQSPNATGLRPDGQLFEKLFNYQRQPIDVVYPHAPGTLLGDRIEANSIQRNFPEAIQLRSPKWRIGHTLGAASLFSLLDAVVRPDQPLNPPFQTKLSFNAAYSWKNALLVSAGFGGIGASIILSRD